EGGQSEGGDKVHEIVVAQVNRGNPKADAGNQVKLETPRFVDAIEKQEEARHGAVQAGKDIHAVAAEPDYFRVPTRDPPARERHGKLIGHDQVRTFGRQQRISEETKSINAEQTNGELPEGVQIPDAINDNAEEQIREKEDVTCAEKLRQHRMHDGLHPQTEIRPDQPMVNLLQYRVGRARAHRRNSDFQMGISQVHRHEIKQEPRAPTQIGFL